MHHAVICDDPSHTFDLGTIAEGINTIAQLKRKSVDVLPYDPELPRLANVGYVQTYWGGGWLFNRNAGERGCPTMLHVTTTCRFIYWAARIAPVEPDGPMAGTLRLVHSSDQARSLGRGMRQLQHVQTMPIRDERCGATVYGKGEFTPNAEGLLFLELYAVGQFRVKWLAVTQHHDDFRVE